MPTISRKRKRPKNDNNATRYMKFIKMDDDEVEECDVFYPMEDICEYLENKGLLVGGGSQLTTRTTHTKQLLDAFISYGWRRKYVQTKFEKLHDKLINAYPVHVFIEEYAKLAVKRLESCDSVLRSLVCIGLRHDIALHLDNVVRRLWNESYTDLQIVETAIFYLLGKYTPLKSPTTKYLIESNKTDIWINYTHPDSKPIAIYNISRRCSISYIEQFNAALMTLPTLSTSDYTLHFHTTSWKGSLSIMEGVNRLVSRNCLDFGIFPGFYMSPASSESIKWGYANSPVWRNEVAIMIFCIPNSIPPHLNVKELIGNEWVQVTSHSRQCEDKVDLKLIKSIDLLYGNMVQNTSVVRKGGYPVPHVPVKKQLVSKTDVGDAFVHNCLVGCVYFEK
jgi:hypothetical protein